MIVSSLEKQDFASSEFNFFSYVYSDNIHCKTVLIGDCIIP